MLQAITELHERSPDMNRTIWTVAVRLPGDLGKRLKELTSALPGVCCKGAEVLLGGLTEPAVYKAMEALVDLGVARKSGRDICILDRDLIGRLEGELKPFVLSIATHEERRLILVGDIDV